MPLMRIDMIKGSFDESQIKQILDLSYEVMKESFDAPEGDRYQLVTQHEPYEMQILDTGLGFKRSNKVLVFSLTTRPRTKDQKVEFYERLVQELNNHLDQRPEDVMVNLTVNSDEDWSFGLGRGQFMTGELN
ncbi:tautomerase family protein [Companilactobacillus sp.]|uniref:tautomerase family protein n=1 Tax=Companilactobacillus sp. TaxID=2767905 RepID=UPI0025BEB753|nr:tautomerase family protein [Companilactobacillus sp.]MCH4009541.1 tautomerase family protein [Companilactobacillus sp.]MCH4052783.1 tautomerase family protein [Companilactobacillus sp.]MCH4077483.1 tautomerase family protein [Companilactobacillus sp.]MCH4126059.1 tautomerase family protein [Companilactobacillus sp.]MCI1311767.1 tautomerase family protein [Companilactobacillus sp.]